MNADSSQIEYLLLFVFSLKKKENEKEKKREKRRERVSFFMMTISFLTELIST